MLNSDEFDLWSGHYDQSVDLIEDANKYPFAGYGHVLEEIYGTIHRGTGQKILDVGFGTGVLTQKLYHEGYSIFGIDFSARMIQIAKAKMPKATLIQHDFTKGLPLDFSEEQFDFIVSTYAIHHLTEDEKIHFIQLLLSHLKPDGKLLLGDVAFETQDELEKCKIASGDSWDEGEIYMVLDSLKSHFPNADFKKISYCAGVVGFQANLAQNKTVSG